MFNISRSYQSLGLSCLSLAIALPAIADENVQRSLDKMLDNSLKSAPTAQNDPVAQVNAVSQLSDVRATDWAFTALQSLVERYGCISGYPDRRFRGQQALSRYEFAAGLNACLDKVNEIVAAGLTDKVSKEDLATLSKLQEEFAAELATLRGRVDSLDAKTSKLEAQQFSTTTKLSGEAIFAVGGVSTGSDTLVSPFGGSAPSKQNIVFQNRVRLNFLTSFTGSDRLRTRLQMGNAQPLLTFNNSIGAASLLAANDGRLGFDDSTIATNNNSVFLEALDYSFPLGDRARVTIFANGGNHFYYADTLNPYFDDQGGGKGAISRFGERNPIYGINGNGAGIGFNYKISDNFKLDLGYLANTANTPTSATGSGLTGGNYSALAQLVYQPSDRFKAGLTYVLGYNGTSGGQTGFRYGGAGQATGSFLGNLIAGARLIPTDATSGIPTTPVSSNSYGAQFSYSFSPHFVVGGWAGYTSARLLSLGDADIWNYAISFAFPNLGKEGNLLGIVVGVEPTLKGIRTYAGASLPLANNNVWHIEAFYKYQVTNNISITPGVIWIANPNQVSTNNNLFIGTVRTTFSF
ncbi:carbohydrate porin [Pseudanabaena sp. FACHB-1277]|uniref:Carbohydrate porin n=1 Tax=Pseudanabaena cinerea FACHB-1277 TaxID=2949581 RepID=A0A926UWR9_9CYAN|nr:iron uptake porin [Pseudanabaena cinerea]MBD2152694.1 carbohydrate porin [Pseudanabaena cinerea FACHB-1277]